MDYQLGKKPPQAPGGSLEDIFTSPLFLMGANVLGADNVGTGLAQGVQQAGRFSAQKQDMAERSEDRAAAQAEQQKAAQRESAFNDLISSGQLKGLPMGVPQLAQVLGPDKGATLISGALNSAQRGGKIINAGGRLFRETENGVEEVYAPPPSSSDRLIEDLLARRGANSQSGEQQLAPMPLAQPPPQLQPQSFESGQPMPGVVLTAGGQPAQMPEQAIPGDQQPQQQPSADMVDTPYGRMTRDEARRMGGAMLLDPKTAAAGKVILDAAQPAGAALTEPTANEIDKQQFNSIQALARLKDIEQQTDPDFLTIEGKAELRFAEFLNSFRSGQKLVTPGDRKKLEDFQSWRASSWDNANRYIKEITGAQMSEAEASRLLRAMPNPGTGVFDGDDPASFGAKMKQVIKTMRLSIARYNFLRKNGFSGDANAASTKLPLHQMEGVIERKANELQQQLLQANPGIKKQDANRILRQQLKSEFGMDV